MMMSGGEIAPAPEPPIPPSLLFELSEATTQADYDTNIKLFDEPKSFTILGTATFNNYNWTSWTQGIFGISTGNYFRYGSIQSGKDMIDGELSATANRYTAIIMNYTSTGKYCSSLASRENTSKKRKFGIRYNHRTRKIECFNTTSGTTSHWWTLGGDLSSNSTLKLLIGSATGTVNVFKIYSGLLSDADIVQFINDN